MFRRNSKDKESLKLFIELQKTNLFVITDMLSKSHWLQNAEMRARSQKFPESINVLILLCWFILEHYQCFHQALEDNLYKLLLVFF